MQYQHISIKEREKRLKNEAIRTYVVTKLKKGWSPEQIAGKKIIQLREKIKTSIR